MAFVRVAAESRVALAPAATDVPVAAAVGALGALAGEAGARRARVAYAAVEAEVAAGDALGVVDAQRAPVGGGQQSSDTIPQGPAPLLVLQEPLKQVAVLQQVEPAVPSQDTPGGTHTRPRGFWLSHPQQPLLSQASPGQQCSPVAPQGLQVEVLVPVKAQTVLPKHTPAKQQGWPASVVVS